MMAQQTQAQMCQRWVICTFFFLAKGNSTAKTWSDKEKATFLLHRVTKILRKNAIFNDNGILFQMYFNFYLHH